MSGAEFFETSLLVTAAALIIERTFGYPDQLVRLVGHPVVWTGNLIGWLDRILNRPDWPEGKRKLSGLLALLLTIVVSGGVALALMLLLRTFPYGWVAEALLASSMLSQKELGERVEAVADGLEQGIDQGRNAVRHLVGRDRRSLGESEVAKGAIESLAENSSDGIVAPAVWMMSGGLLGAVIYKAVNTLDSMIGYKSERHRSFGWASARFDDLMNLIPARVSGLLYCLCALFLDRERGKLAWQSMLRDAPTHVSPNAGYPEAAMAGSLDIALGGPRSYGGTAVDLPYMGTGRKNITSDDIRSAVALYKLKLTVLAFAVLAPVILLITP